MPSKKVEPTPPDDAIVNRLEEGLEKSDQELVKEQFARYAVDNRTDLRLFKATKKDHVDHFFNHLAAVSPLWEGLGHIDDIWDEVAIVHLKATLKNQLRDNGAPLAAKMEAYRKSKDQHTTTDPDPSQIDTTKSKKATPAKGKQLGKRTRQTAGDMSPMKATPAKLPASQKEEPEEQAGEPAKEKRFDPTMFTTAEWAIVENELECEALWKTIRIKKRELKSLYQRW